MKQNVNNDASQEPMSRSMQLYYIPIMAIVID